MSLWVWVSVCEKKYTQAHNQKQKKNPTQNKPLRAHHMDIAQGVCLFPTMRKTPILPGSSLQSSVDFKVARAGDGDVHSCSDSTSFDEGEGEGEGDEETETGFTNRWADRVDVGNARLHTQG